MNKSIIIPEPGKVEITSSDMPVRKEGEALLKLLYGGICGSDLSIYRGTFAYVSYPRIPGHEFSAEIVEIGENQQGLKPGMIVTANPYFNCGTCYSCKRGLVNCCTSNETLGCQRDGAFSAYFTMPVERLYDGQGVEPKKLALIEPFCISFHGIQRANVHKNDRVLIVGGGTIGILALIAAKEAGGIVTVSDVSEDKLKQAKFFGADGTIINRSEKEFMKQVNEMTDGDGFDVVVEAVGLPQTFQNCIDAAAFGARFVLIGVGKKNSDFNFTLIQKKELNIFGSRNAVKNDFLQIIQAVKEGRVDIGSVITNIYPFEKAVNAFADFDKNQGNMLKVMIEF